MHRPQTTLKEWGIMGPTVKASFIFFKDLSIREREKKHKWEGQRVNKQTPH